MEYRSGACGAKGPQPSSTPAILQLSVHRLLAEASSDLAPHRPASPHLCTHIIFAPCVHSLLGDWPVKQSEQETIARKRCGREKNQSHSSSSSSSSSSFKNRFVPPDSVSSASPSLSWIFLLIVIFVILPFLVGILSLLVGILALLVSKSILNINPSITIISIIIIIVAMFFSRVFFPQLSWLRGCVRMTRILW